MSPNANRRARTVLAAVLRRIETDRRYSPLPAWSAAATETGQLLELHRQRLATALPSLIS